MLTGHDPTDLMCPGDYTSAASYHQPVPGYHPGGGCDQLLASQSLMTSASADLNHYSGQETGPVSQPIRGQNSGHVTSTDQSEHVSMYCFCSAEIQLCSINVIAASVQIKKIE